MPRPNPFDQVRFDARQSERLTRLRCMFWDVWHLIDLLVQDDPHRARACDALDDAFLHLVRSIGREETS